MGSSSAQRTRDNTGWTADSAVSNAVHLDVIMLTRYVALHVKVYDIGLKCGQPCSNAPMIDGIVGQGIASGLDAEARHGAWTHQCGERWR